MCLVRTVFRPLGKESRNRTKVFAFQPPAIAEISPPTFAASDGASCILPRHHKRLVLDRHPP